MVGQGKGRRHHTVHHLSIAKHVELALVAALLPSVDPMF
jgi:hypothetical protein